MKKMICFLLAALLLAGGLGGCAQREASGAPAPAAQTQAAGAPEAAGENAFEAENEIYTYQRIDPAKTQIVVSRTGNIAVEDLCRAFEEKNPDVQVIYLDITGGNAGYKPLNEWITRGHAPDVAISAAIFSDGALTTQYFENLSADPILQNYEAAALKRTAVDGNIYWLPGPSDISAMMYNKTLFAQYGWEVPATFDEFVALCDQIRADTNGEVEPWNPNAKYDKELQTAMEAITYQELFGGVDNRSWYNDYIQGNSSFSGHMEPYMDALKTLADHGILREEHFTYSATARGKEFAAGKIAMINMNIYDADNDEFDFGYMPFPATKGELGYVCDSYSCYVGLPIKEHTEKQTAAIRRFLEFFSSAEGQRAYIGEAMKVSNVKGVSVHASDDLASLQPAIDAGHMFAMLEFGVAAGAGKRVSLQQCAMDIVSGKMTPEECIEAADALLAAPAEPAAEKKPEVIATVSEDMTILETSFLIADAYREAAGAQIGLIAHNVAYRGNMMRLFTGDVTPDIITVLKPRSFANDASLVKLSMTGSQLLDALDHPAGNESVADCVYACSGLRCTVAPWNEPGSRMLSVRLADGSEIEPDKLYTVAAWAGTVGEKYITETLDTYEGTWEEMMSAKLAADKTIAPARDGRIELVWE